MPPVATVVNGMISLVVSWFLYLGEANYFDSQIQMITQLIPPMGLLIRVIVFVADFVLVFWVLSIIFERFT